MSKALRSIPVFIAWGILASVLISGGPRAAAAAETRRVTERSVTLDQVPQAAREALLREAGEHKILEVDEISGPDGLSYEAEWLVDGREFEVRVDGEGKILGRPGEGEDDDAEGEDVGGDDPEGEEDDAEPGS